ncbi:MAG: DUF4190 domain-containing protein [Actinomycetota bacterium]
MTADYEAQRQPREQPEGQGAGGGPGAPAGPPQQGIQPHNQPPPEPYFQQRPPGYPQNRPDGYGPPMVQQTNGLAVASLVLGILWLGWLGSLLALIFGYAAKGQIDRSNGAQGGRGLAIAGIVLGWIGVAFFLLLFVLPLFFLAAV